MKKDISLQWYRYRLGKLAMPQIPTEPDNSLATGRICAARFAGNSPTTEGEP